MSTPSIPLPTEPHAAETDLDELLVGALRLAVHRRAHVVQDGHETRWPLQRRLLDTGRDWLTLERLLSLKYQGFSGVPYRFGLDQVADDLVVEKVNRRPLDAFSIIFGLLGAQRELNENLLQLLVDVIDAKLLEPVFLESRQRSKMSAPPWR